MIVERNIFQLKFGMSKTALALWKEYLAKVQAEDPSVHVRVLTDISGKGYALVVEQSFATFAEAEPSACKLVQRPDWRPFYQEFIPLCEGSERTYFRVQVDF